MHFPHKVDKLVGQNFKFITIISAEVRLAHGVEILYVVCVLQDSRQQPFYVFCLSIQLIQQKAKASKV